VSRTHSEVSRIRRFTWMIRLSSHRPLQRKHGPISILSTSRTIPSSPDSPGQTVYSWHTPCRPNHTWYKAHRIPPRRLISVDLDYHPWKLRWLVVTSRVTVGRRTRGSSGWTMSVGRSVSCPCLSPPPHRPGRMMVRVITSREPYGTTDC
jgi:hypothetical protein